jgi:polyhydroxybutyrate depolymerase
MAKRLASAGVVLVTIGGLWLVAAQPQPLARETWIVDGVERTALVAAPPARAGGSERPPLVLVFHGHGGTSENAARTFRIHADWPEALVVYPQGLPTPGRLTDPRGTRPGWQSGVGEQDDRDLLFVDAILKWARTRYAIDERRLYAAGHSNGGSMVYVLWAARGEFFTAFAPSSSVFQRRLLSSARPKPAFIVAGEKDRLVPFAIQKPSLVATLALNQADSTGAPWSGRAVLHRSAIGADVVAYVHPGDHQMPADAGALMVKFFKERELPPTIR